MPAGPVTVAITNWNGAAFLDDCLDAALALRGEVSEVVVVDNASTDDSVERIRRRAPRVRLVQMARNEGPCPARNRGLAEARTSWVLQLDSDVILPPDLLERLWPETAGARVAIVQPRAVLASDPSVRAAPARTSSPAPSITPARARTTRASRSTAPPLPRR